MRISISITIFRQPLLTQKKKENENILIENQFSCKRPDQVSSKFFITFLWLWFSSSFFVILAYLLFFILISMAFIMFSVSFHYKYQTHSIPSILWRKSNNEFEIFSTFPPKIFLWIPTTWVFPILSRWEECFLMNIQKETMMIICESERTNLEWEWGVGEAKWISWKT